MRIDLGAKVRTSEGKSAGHVNQAIWDPRNNEITGYVVSTGGLLGHDVIVSGEMLGSAAREGDEIALALEQGDVVCIFPEGRITDTGEMYPFRPGIRRIVERTPVPVVPLALRGLWGSFFSRKGGPAMTRPFRRGVLSRIGLVAGVPVPPHEVTPEGLQERVLALRGDRR